LDGPAVVDGIFTIPLAGRNCVDASGPAAAVHPSAQFVAGEENRLAGHALRPFIARTATLYSPLVLYGPRGAGKSHLAYGLAAHWRDHYPERGAECLPAGEFAREHSAAISQDRLEDWRRGKRALWLLVLEDITQLGGKRAAQHELVSLFDELADREALVVVTARSLPTHSAVLVPALRSRLSAGLAVRLSLPGPQTRRAILEKLAAARGLSLSKRVIHSLADSLPTSVAALAGALAELELRARTDGQPIDARRVRAFVTERGSSHAPTLREIAALAGKYFGFSLADLKSPKRRQPLVRGRGVAMYLVRQLTGKSFEEIGEYFGGRDHTTVLYGCRRTESLLARDRATRRAVAEIKGLLNVS
jgi:chromosomal replication initiator protein